MRRRDVTFGRAAVWARIVTSDGLNGCDLVSFRMPSEFNRWMKDDPTVLDVCWGNFVPINSFPLKK